jgi:hypothetical protein
MPRDLWHPDQPDPYQVAADALGKALGAAVDRVLSAGPDALQRLLAQLARRVEVRAAQCVIQSPTAGALYALQVWPAAPQHVGAVLVSAHGLIEVEDGSVQTLHLYSEPHGAHPYMTCSQFDTTDARLDTSATISSTDNSWCAVPDGVTLMVGGNSPVHRGIPLMYIPPGYAITALFGSASTASYYRLHVSCSVLLLGEPNGP